MQELCDIGALLNGNMVRKMLSGRIETYFKFLDSSTANKSLF